MTVEFTCLSCTRTFAIPVADLPRMDYLSCIGCGKPVPVDLIHSLQHVCKSFSFDTDGQKNESLWHIRFKEKD
jgi:DNA-directed RNA polymerase subunit RPC12/RpoP